VIAIDLHGKLIAFEGIDGSGKSTQVERLADRLRSHGLSVQVTREPGGTAIGEQVRALLLTPESAALLPLSELLLFIVSRAQLTAEVIRPALERGDVVLTSRFRASSVAFQGHGRKLDRALVQRLNEVATAGLQPDVTFLIDIPVDRALARLAGTVDRIEQETVAFHERVRAGYLEIASKDPAMIVLDGTQPTERLAEEIARHLET
jgi:dTMP kinase